MNKDIYDKYVAHSYGRQGLMLNLGANCTAVGDDGGEYVDFTSGIGVNALGYCNEAWANAVIAQVKKLQHVSNLYYNERGGELAERLCTRTGYARVFFGNSGAEANECAIKTARKYSFDKYDTPDRNVIITLQNSFHGRTVTTLSATGQEHFHNYFFPFTGGFKYVPVNDIDALRQALTPDVCAVMFEYIQGESGVYPLTQEYADALFALTSQRDILTIADEIQTGVGRTGKFLCGERYGKTADITTLAKGLGGGLPIGACLVGEKCADVLTPGTHGSTFGANPVVAAGACAVLDALTPGFLLEVEERGRYIEDALRKLDWLFGIDRAGLMIGASLAGGRKIADVVALARERGLLVLSAKERLRLLPPLNISYAEIDKGLAALAGA